MIQEPEAFSNAQSVSPNGSENQINRQRILITVHLETDNTIIHQREDVFIVDKTDEITQALQAVAQRSGKPVEEVLRQFSLDTVKDKLARDEELQKIVKDFENKIKAKTRTIITLNGSITW